MKRILISSVPSVAFTLSLLAATIALSAVAEEKESEAGFKSLFNGKDLAGWAGRPQHWSVEGGAITGRTTKEHPAEGNNFLIWKGGTVSDFELRLSYKIVPNNDNGFANSGIQYRSKDFDNFVVGGYQADMEAGKTYSGILYEERMDGILAQRGQKTVVKTVEGKTSVHSANPRTSRRRSRTRIGTITSSSPQVITSNISSTACKRWMSWTNARVARGPKKASSPFNCTRAIR